MTSHDCVMRMRRIFKTKKVGHTGTLDPEVEGVLPICIGQATKIVPFLTATTKTYEAELTLGTATETEDKHGATIEVVPVDHPPAKHEVEEVLKSFVGEITQIPPMYSAVKVNGKKLYEYARANQTVERPQRQVTIFRITPKDSSRWTTTACRFEVECSKGTYIRTLCVDIGKALGYPAHMSDLVRTKTGAIHAEDTIRLEEVEAVTTTDGLAQLLLPMTMGITHLDVLYVDTDLRKRVQYGQKLMQPKQPLKTNPFAVMYQDELLAIYQKHPDHDDQIKPVRVFGERE